MAESVLDRLGTAISTSFKRFRDAVRRALGLPVEVPPPIPPPPVKVPPAIWLNVVWGHLIYKPIKKGRWKVLRGMTRLSEFITYAEGKDLKMTRTDHPLALEMYARFTLDHEITEKEYAIVIESLANQLEREFFYPVLKEYMEWGVESEPTDREEEVEAVKRWSRDGDNFEEEDISAEIRAEILRRIK